MRALSLILVVLFALIQYPLWLGKGGWLRVLELDRQLSIARQTNFRMEVKNQSLEGEVRDLKQGLLAIEERARYELGMVRSDELFIQINAIPKASVPPIRRDGLGLGNDVPPLASGAGPIPVPERYR
jgi:cell division protein FtsB